MKPTASFLCYHCDETDENIVKKKYIKPSQTELLMKYYLNNKQPLEGYRADVNEENFTSKFSICDKKKAREHARIAHYGNQSDYDEYMSLDDHDEKKLYFYCQENEDVITIPKKE
jgi:hypothetical protein